MGATQQPNFYNPRGIPLPDVPPPTKGGTATHLLRSNRARGVSPDHRTGRTRWAYPHQIPLDIAERAREAAARGNLARRERETGPPEPPRSLVHIDFPASPRCLGDCP
jgi:hypothetical protein